jgi:myo-inositol-1(or 4)-monophosphatase
MPESAQLTQRDAAQLLAAVTPIARQAGAILREGFGGRVAATDKEGRHNLVTEYDLRVEEFLHKQLSALVPHSSFLGEEGGERLGTANFTWVVDPLDGTVNFAHGIPIFCVSIGAVLDGELELGVIYHPLLDEMFHGARGHGAYLGEQRLAVSHTATVQESILVTGFPYNVHENPENCLDQFVRVVGRGLPVRRLGSAALDLAYTAAGRFDGFWEVRLHAWDMAAGALLVREAGGHVTHYHNREFELGHDSIVATNGIIHQELIQLLAH